MMHAFHKALSLGREPQFRYHYVPHLGFVCELLPPMLYLTVYSRIYLGNRFSGYFGGYDVSRARSRLTQSSNTMGQGSS